jgi:hypothetical protein
VEPDADDAPLGVISIRADGVDPWLGDNARSLHRDLVIHGACPGTPGHTASCDTVPSPGFLGAIGLGVSCIQFELVQKREESLPMHL